jgi:hypothetical protein
MDEARKILEFEISDNELDGFMQNNRPILANEIITTAEEMLYNKIDVATVCKIKVKRGRTKTILHCRLTIDDVIRDIQSLLDWSVELEEYELSHRIKLLIDYINENDIRRKKKTGFGSYEAFENTEESSA